jgi:hypothetical protein
MLEFEKDKLSSQSTTMPEDEYEEIIMNDYAFFPFI